MNKPFISILCCILMLPAYAEAASIEIGTKGSQTSLLVMNSSETELGEIGTNLNSTLYLSLTSTPTTFSDSHWGYFYAYEMSTFHLDKQVLPDAIDIGTSVNGFYAHITPVLFYQFPNFSIQHISITNTAGIGIGIGYMKIKGSIKTDLITPQYNIPVDDSSFATTVGVYWESVINDTAVFRVSSYGPSTNFNGYNYQLFDISIYLGYRLNFDLANLTP